MFALIAFSGDCGAAIGPGLVGLISEKVQSSGVSFVSKLLTYENTTQLALKTSLLFAAVFPLVMAIAMLFGETRKGTKK